MTNKIAKIVGNTIIVNDLTQFDLAAILHSGQVFRYFPLPDTANGFILIAGQQWAKLHAYPDRVEIVSSDSQYFWQYFDFGTDYQAIKAQLSHPKLQQALVAGGGIRILRAEFYEMVISFIISANNNIKRFTKSLNGLAAQFGTYLPEVGQYAFPDLVALTKITVADWRALGCGYRAPLLVRAVTELQNLSFTDLAALPTPILRKKLLALSGVGPKVAACILLFAFHRLEVAPVDTWIKKALGQLSPTEEQEILQGPYAGVAQQYIFYYLQYLHAQTL